jgi:hypothetical protein
LVLRLIGRLLVLRPALLRLRLSAVRLRLLTRLVLRLLRVAKTGLALHRRCLHRHRLTGFVIVAFELVVAVALDRGALLRLVVRILLTELFLRRSDEAEIMLGVLVVVLSGHRVAGGLGVAGELKVLLGHVVRGSSDLHLRTVRLVNPRQRIVVVVMMMTAAAVVTLIAVSPPHALVLTVSHSSPIAHSCLQRLCPAGSFIQPEASFFSPPVPTR